MAERSMAEGEDSLEAGIARLSPVERRVLELLARGHTVKSIADELKLTPHAVNEWLRAARRKCGVGSSRELARLVDLQKDRDQENRTAEEAQAPPSERPTSPLRRERRVTNFGALLMVLFLFAAAAVLWQAGPQISVAVSPAPADAVVDSITATPVPDLRELHALAYRGGTVETHATEGKLRAAYEVQPTIARGVSDLKVICGPDVCEVSGKLNGRGKAINPAVQALQGKALNSAVAATPLSGVTTVFGGLKGSDQQVFVAYWVSAAEAARLDRKR